MSIQTTLAVGLLVGALGAGGVGVQTWRLHSAQAALSEVRAQFSDARAAAVTRQRDFERAYQHSKDAAEAQKRIDDEANDRTLASLRAQRDGLRQQLAAFAAGGRGPAEDSVADCRRRADVLGLVLDSALRAEEDVVGAAEREAAGARSLRGQLEQPAGALK